MIANYGYTDGSGSFYITINTDACPSCTGSPCIAACPESLFAVEPDDYDDPAALIRREFWKQIKYKCAPCKPVGATTIPPCVSMCPAEAISHSW